MRFMAGLVFGGIVVSASFITGALCGATIATAMCENHFEKRRKGCYSK